MVYLYDNWQRPIVSSPLYHVFYCILFYINAIFEILIIIKQLWYIYYIMSCKKFTSYTTLFE